MGAAATDKSVSEVYKQRLNHAVELYNEEYINKIIVTGGKSDGNEYSDAEIARRYLVEQGVKAEDLLLEEASTITQENLENSKKIMDKEGVYTTLIISDPLHMKRAMLLAKDIGISSYSSPTKTSAYKSLKTKIPFVYFSEELYISVEYEVVEPEMKSRFVTLNVYTHLGFEEAAEEMRRVSEK